MVTCQICLSPRRKLRFQTSRLKICHACVEKLNDWHEVAEPSYQEIGELLRSGIRQRLGPSAIEAQIAAEHARALPGWLTRLLEDPHKSTKPFRIIRAHRRGVLHRDRPRSWGYPADWAEVAAKIRQLDEFACVLCGADDDELHVHHIVYVSNYGTHAKHNLITLCRSCHEEEHERTFDRGEDLEQPVQRPAEDLLLDVAETIEHQSDSPPPPTRRDRLLEDCAYVLTCLAEECSGEAKSAVQDLVRRLEADEELPELFRLQLLNAAIVAGRELLARRYVNCASLTWQIFRSILESNPTFLEQHALTPSLPLRGSTPSRPR